MMEMLKILSMIVWIGVGLTTIGATIWGLTFYKKFYSRLLDQEEA